MFYVYISPAKALNKENESLFEISTPVYQDVADSVANILKTFDESYIKKTMKVNDDLAKKVYKYYQEFNINLAPAIFKYNGLVYKNIAPNSMNDDELNYLHDHLLIGSGLYGILKAFDGISNYRLELNKKIKEIPDMTKLYQDKIQNYFNEDDVIINLASEEYSTLIQNVKCKVVRINFIKHDHEKCTMLQTHGKIYRGKMVRFLASNNVTSIEDITKFQDKNLQLLSYNDNEVNFIEVA